MVNQIRGAAGVLSASVAISPPRRSNMETNAGGAPAPRATDTVTLSQAALDRAGEKKQNARYDFSSMTPQRMLQAMNDLIKSGELSFDESSPLVIMIPTALAKVQYDGRPPDAYCQPKNFMALLTSAIAAAASRSDKASVAYFSNSLRALERIQGTNWGRTS